MTTFLIIVGIIAIIAGIYFVLIKTGKIGDRDGDYIADEIEDTIDDVKDEVNKAKAKVNKNCKNCWMTSAVTQPQFIGQLN